MSARIWLVASLAWLVWFAGSDDIFRRSRTIAIAPALFEEVGRTRIVQRLCARICVRSCITRSTTFFGVSSPSSRYAEDDFRRVKCLHVKLEGISLARSIFSNFLGLFLKIFSVNVDNKVALMKVWFTSAMLRIVSFSFECLNKDKWCSRVWSFLPPISWILAFYFFPVKLTLFIIVTLMSEWRLFIHYEFDCYSNKIWLL